MDEKLLKIIYKNIDSVFLHDSLTIIWWLDGHDFNKPIKNFDAISVHNKTLDYETIFRIYMENYWAYTAEGDIKKQMSPILSFETKYETKFDLHFSEDIWHKPTIDWFKNKFPDLKNIKIKTIL